MTLAGLSPAGVLNVRAGEAMLLHISLAQADGVTPQNLTGRTFAVVIRRTDRLFNILTIDAELSEDALYAQVAITGAQATQIYNSGASVALSYDVVELSGGASVSRWTERVSVSPGPGIGGEITPIWVELPYSEALLNPASIVITERGGRGLDGASAARHLYDLHRIDAPTAEAFDAYITNLNAAVDRRVSQLTTALGIFNAQALAPWFRAVFDVRTQRRDAVALFAGDSTFTGYYRTGIAPDRSTSIPSQFALLAPDDWYADDAFITGHNISGLTAGREGEGNDGIIWDLRPWNDYQAHAKVDLGPGDLPTANAPVEFGAAGVGGYAFRLMPFDLTGTYNGITYKPRDIRTGGYKKTDRLVVYYITTASAGGNFRVYCDGILVGTVQTVTGTQDGFAHQIFNAPTALGEHVWRIENDGSIPSQDVFIAGFYGYDSSRKQVRVINGSRSGWPVSQYAHNSPFYGPMVQLDVYDPDMLGVGLNINSGRNWDHDDDPMTEPLPAMSLEDFRADTVALIMSQRNRGKATLLITPRPVGYDVMPQETQDAYNAVYEELAIEYNCALLDSRLFGDRYEILSLLGFMADTRHPDQYGDSALMLASMPGLGGGLGGPLPVARSPYLPRSGGALTGPISLPADPAVPFRFNGALPANATLTRASSGTYINSAGVRQTATSNVARFQYRLFEGLWIAAGLLVEPATSNLCLYSEDFSNAYWSKSAGLALTPNAGPALDGVTGMTLVTTAGADLIRHAATLAVTAGQKTTVSVMLKAGSISWIRLRIGDNINGTNAAQLWVNLAAGKIGTLSTTGTGWTVDHGAIEPLGNGAYRVGLTFTPGAATAALRISTATSDGSGSTAVSGSTYYLGGVQIEPLDRMTSYLLTTTAIVTRAADVVAIDWSLPRHRPVGPLALTYGFGDGSSQSVTGVALTAGVSSIPTSLNRNDILTVAET
ncbi:SGNH/GDSL hydrolase family protein [Sphingobium sp.]|uniref:SGNH/GDSL hydrolase family protein n=1 Tax=Sphingobium sp. TaxID=1912891 RepID=UPI002E1F8FD7